MGRQGRPPTRPGTYGVITAVQVRPTICRRCAKRRECTNEGHWPWRARTLYRDARGKVRRPSKTAPTKTAAEDGLKETIARWVTEDTAGHIGPHTKVDEVAALWLAELDDQVERGAMSSGTLARYRSTYRVHVKEQMGRLRCDDVFVITCEKTITAARATHSIDTAQGVRTVLSGICNYAVRHGGMDDNPVRHVADLRRGDDDITDVRTIAAEDRARLLLHLEAWVATKTTYADGRPMGKRAQVWLDVPDLARCSMSIGGRIGELLAVDDTDIRARPDGRVTVLLGHHIVRATGRGLIRKRARKGRRRAIELIVPQWSAPTWLARKQAAEDRGGGPVFPATTGGWQDPTAVTKRLRAAFDGAGFPGLSSRMFRATVATHLDAADLPLTAIADQLGNTTKVVERHYRAPRATNQAAADALETLLGHTDH